MSCSLDEPEAAERSEHTRWERHRAVFQCLLNRAGYTPPANFKVKVPRAQTLVAQLNRWRQPKTPPVAIAVPQADLVDLATAGAWFEEIRAINLALKEEQRQNSRPQIGLTSSTPGNPWVDPQLESMLNMLVHETSRKTSFGGWRAIRAYIPYHSPRRSLDVTGEIIAHLDAGKIVILDLSAGPVEIREVLSERIASQIFFRQMGQMNAGEVPQNVVLYVEEAHNLIGRKSG